MIRKRQPPPFRRSPRAGSSSATWPSSTTPPAPGTRLCIARAILKRPKILILDDSTSAVDSGTEAAIRESFDHHLAQTTVLIIAQRISSVRDADKIVVLDDGKVIGISTHRSLLADNVVHQEINQSQREGVMAQ